MCAWSTCERHAWLESVDAAGLGSALHANAASGADLLTLTEAIWVNDFAAYKLRGPQVDSLAARILSRQLLGVAYHVQLPHFIA